VTLRAFHAQEPVSQAFPLVAALPSTLSAVADDGSVFAGWGGHADCSDGIVQPLGSLTCVATFTMKPRIFNGNYYPAIQTAYDAASSGDFVEALGVTFTETLLFDRAVNVTFRGAYDLFFNTITGLTTVSGSLKISNAPSLSRTW
jgi:hypothetical protein